MTEFVPNGATKGGAGKISFPIVTVFNMTVAALDDTICIGTSTTLTANTKDPSYNNTILWYDEPFGGNLLATGSSFTTPNLVANTTY